MYKVYRYYVLHNEYKVKFFSKNSFPDKFDFPKLKSISKTIQL